MSAKQLEENKSRIPIVTILGHVDHGKTTILDKIRSSNVQEKEAGGITQKISVFTIDIDNKIVPKLSFVDTPGHEAFDLMRQRGGDIADIVLLIIAADDGIKPQTEESIEIIKNSSAKPIVVFNKIDLPNIDIEKIKRELASKDIQVEGFGGSIPVVEVSGKTGEGIDTLLETIGLVIEVEGIDLKDDLSENVSGKAYILESVKDASRGYVSTMIITSGKMSVADWLVYELEGEIQIEKVKGFVTESDDNLRELSAGEGAKIIGLSEMLDLGTVVYSSSAKDKKQFVSLFEKKEVEGATEEEGDWFAEFFSDDETKESEQDIEKKKLNVIIKSSSEGSLQALKSTIDKIDIDGYKANIINASVGEVTLSDVDQAEITKSIILAFEVGADNLVKKEALNRKILIRQYDIIYRLTDEISDVLTAMSAPKETEEEIGDAQVREIFVLSNGSKVIGGRVMNGIIKRNEKCYVVRDDEIIGTGRIVSLKHNKNDVNEAQKGADFGAIVEPTPKDVEVGDSLHCFKVVK